MTGDSVLNPNNKPVRILLTGGNGQVGWALQSCLKSLGEVWAPTRLEFNLSEPESLREKIRSYKPDLIVNAGAYTAVDLAESEFELASVINTEAPKVLAQEANRLQVPLISYSTDYVFDGKKPQPYTENDEPNPLNVYGQTKLAGERAIQEFHDQYLILRTSWVYSHLRGKNFYTTMLRLYREKEELKVVDDQIGAPTSAVYLAQQTTKIIFRWLLNQYPVEWGVFHLTAGDQTSWYGFAEQILKHANVGSTTRLIPISSSEFPTKAIRPQMSLLSNHKINDAMGLEQKDWLEIFVCGL